MSQKSKAARKAMEPVTAFVVAEPIGIKNDFKSVGLPVALAPIANRPAIDYMIENLIHNGIRKIVVLASNSEEPLIRSHINESWAHVGGGNISSVVSSGHRGKSAAQGQHNDTVRSVDVAGAMRSSSDMESIDVRACGSLGNGFFDVITHLKNNNLVRDGSYFIVVPLDSISNISNIQKLVAKAIDRHLTQKLILTAVVRQDDRSLRTIYDSVMQKEISRLEKPSDDNADNMALSFLTPAVQKSMWGDDALADAELEAEQEEAFQTETSFAPRCTVVFDPATGMVQAFKEWKRLDDDALEAIREERGGGLDGIEAPYPPLPSIPIKKHNARVCVRTDLMLTGILICSSDVINCAFDSYQVSIADVVNEFIARQIEWNLDIAIDVADNSAVVCPINSLPALLAANHRVCARYLHPMTRESNFGDVVKVKYSVSRRAPLVCVPQVGCPALRGTIEGAGVFGLDTILHDSSFASNTSMGDFANVGMKVNIVNSIIGKNVTIGDGAVVINSLVLDNAKIPANCEVRDSIFGIVDPTSVRIPSNRHNNRVSDRNGRFTDVALSTVIPTYEMITSDNVTGAVDEDEEDEDWKSVLWDSYLNNKDAETALEIGLKDLRTSFHKTNFQLVQAMFERLMMHLGDVAYKAYLAKKSEQSDEEDEEEDDSEDDKDSFVASWDVVKEELVKKLLLWEREALWHFILRGDDEGAFQVLRGLSIGIAKTNSIQPLAGKILAVFYCLLDPEMFEKRDFCIITSSAIIAFLKQEEAKDSDDEDEEEEDEEEEDSDDDEEDEEELVVKGWRYFANYAGKVREACEDDDDEDEDEDDDEDDE